MASSRASAKTAYSSNMADERYEVMTVECPVCKIRQKIHVAVGASQMHNERVVCIQCNNHFTVRVPDEIIGGPFPE